VLYRVHVRRAECSQFQSWSYRAAVVLLLQAENHQPCGTPREAAAASGTSTPTGLRLQTSSRIGRGASRDKEEDHAGNTCVEPLVPARNARVLPRPEYTSPRYCVVTVLERGLPLVSSRQPFACLFRQCIGSSRGRGSTSVCSGSAAIGHPSNGSPVVDWTSSRQSYFTGEAHSSPSPQSTKFRRRRSLTPPILTPSRHAQRQTHQRAQQSRQARPHRRCSTYTRTRAAWPLLSP